MATAITISAGGVCYAASNADVLNGAAHTVASQSYCHAVNTAIAAYLAQYDAAPHRIADVERYVSGDISGYRIMNGLAAGPGCEPVAAR